MADASRPRPRPRPKLKTNEPRVNSSTPASSSSSSSTLISTSPSKQIVVRDDDEMFMRNRKRTNQAWEKIEKLNKTKVIVISDSDEEHTPHRRSKYKKKDTQEYSWQKIPRLLSVDTSDHSDSDIEVIGESTSKGKGTQEPKRKRQRTRSRSITPPPALPSHQIQNARNVVRQTLGNVPRSASPTHNDIYEEDETVFSNPELARIAQKIASRPANSSPPPTRASSEEVHDTVTISVKWQPHPLNEAGKEDIWLFKMNRDDNFRDLFEATAEEASILTESLVMSYNGTRLYASATPMALRLWGEAEFVACDKTTHDYMRNNPLAVTTFDSATPIEVLSDTEVPSPGGTQDTDGAGSDSDDDTFKLILRSSITKDITLTVRPTTKCGAIVKAFLKKAGVEDQYPNLFGADIRTQKKGRKKSKAQEKEPMLSVDGDKMEAGVEIGEADLEDGDLVEVVGL